METLDLVIAHDSGTMLGVTRTTRAISEMGETPSMVAGSEYARANPAIARDSRVAMGDSALLMMGWHLETTFGAVASTDSPGDGLGGWERGERVEQRMKNAKRPNRVSQMNYKKMATSNEKKMPKVS